MDVHISAATGAHQYPRPLSGGRQHASGSGRSDGGAGGHAGSGGGAAGPRFDAPVAPNGYRWWYLDAASDDGQLGLTIIGFVGSVFSPYYAWARRHGCGDPENFCAINVALYGAKRRWAMTERAAVHVKRTAKKFQVGASQMIWDKDGLTIDVRERCAPLPLPLRGTVRLTTPSLYDTPVQLDATGLHHWRAVAPQARVAVNFDQPRLSWAGPAYCDMNWGDEPLERGFRQWTWARAISSASTDVLYDTERRDGTRLVFGRRFAGGTVTEIAVPASHDLRRGFWGMTRSVRSERPPRLITTLEDAPFYTRNRVQLTLGTESCQAIHESLSLDRFVSPVVQLMLPFRMPRRG